MIEEGRRKDDIAIDQLQEDFNQHKKVEAVTLEKLQTAIDEIQKNTADLVQLWNDAKGFIAIMRIVGKIFKWGSPIVAAALAIYYTAKSGFKP